MTLTVPQEALLKTLSAMINADTNISPTEVKEVQRIMQEELGLEVSSADIHIAANSDFINKQEIHQYLKSVLKHLDLSNKKTIIRTLIKVIHIDGHSNSAERKMFNEVATALDLSPADLVLL